MLTARPITIKIAKEFIGSPHTVTDALHRDPHHKIIAGVKGSPDFQIIHFVFKILGFLNNIIIIFFKYFRLQTCQSPSDSPRAVPEVPVSDNFRFHKEAAQTHPSE